MYEVFMALKEIIYDQDILFIKLKQQVKFNEIILLGVTDGLIYD